MSKVGSLQTNKTWAESLKDLAEEFRKWCKADYVLPTLAESKRLGKVRVTFALNGIWHPLECSIGSYGNAIFFPEVSLRAIVMAIEGARKADQRGIGALLAAATQHLALPSGESNPYDVLGVAKIATKEQIRTAYVRRVKETHPDLDGDNSEFVLVQKAGEQLGVA